MSPKDAKTNDNAGLKHASDFGTAQSAQLEGDKIEMDELVGEEVKLLNYAVLPSKQTIGADYVILQVEIEGKKRVAMTSAKAVVMAFGGRYMDANTKQVVTYEPKIKHTDLPILITLDKVKAGNGKKVWTLK